MVRTTSLAVVMGVEARMPEVWLSGLFMRCLWLTENSLAFFRRATRIGLGRAPREDLHLPQFVHVQRGQSERGVAHPAPAADHWRIHRRIPLATELLLVQREHQVGTLLVRRQVGVDTRDLERRAVHVRGLHGPFQREREAAQVSCSRHGTQHSARRGGCHASSTGRRGDAAHAGEEAARPLNWTYGEDPGLPGGVTSMAVRRAAMAFTRAEPPQALRSVEDLCT